MATQTSNIVGALEQAQQSQDSKKASSLLGELIQADQYVGELYSLSYETALVQIHDFYRRKVGGIPSLSFLIASRVDPANLDAVDYRTEDASVLLLRVMDAASLPNQMEAERLRSEVAMQVSGETSVHWDTPGMMDAKTNQYLSFAGIKCRVIGTFFLDRVVDNRGRSRMVLRFGSDISNYYPNQGLKVYKPNSSALARIVNYRDPDRIDPLSS